VQHGQGAAREIGDQGDGHPARWSTVNLKAIEFGRSGLNAVTRLKSMSVLESSNP
jgi:hypothetical protein